MVTKAHLPCLIDQNEELVVLIAFRIHTKVTIRYSNKEGTVGQE